MGHPLPRVVCVCHDSNPIGSTLTQLAQFDISSNHGCTPLQASTTFQYLALDRLRIMAASRQTITDLLAAMDRLEVAPRRRRRPRGPAPSRGQIISVSRDVVLTLQRIDVHGCYIGSMACMLFGLNRTPNVRILGRLGSGSEHLANACAHWAHTGP